MANSRLFADMTELERLLADELQVRPQQVQAAVALLDGGATVPFIARYRKEATGGLDDVQLRQLSERLIYLRELNERRASVLASIEAQGKLTPALQAALEAVTTKQALEDLYLPYKPKRRTKGMMAQEAGLVPLAQRLWDDPSLDPVSEAQAFVRPLNDPEGTRFDTPQGVLDGVRDWLSEQWAEDASLVQLLRDWLWSVGELTSQLATGQNPDHPDTAKFKDYWDYREPLHQVPSHRALAVLRGRQLGMLDARVSIPEALQAPSLHALGEAESRLARHLGWQHQQRAADDFLRRCVIWTWKVKLLLSSERDVLARLRASAEAVAIEVFGANLRDVLLAPPAGAKTVMGLDPGIRTGVKVAVVDPTGKLLHTCTVYPHEPRRDWQGAGHTLAALCAQHQVSLIAIGNGTASRETDRLAGEVIQRPELASLHIAKMVVSEAGASVYSASEYASQEFPDLDVSLRGAVSIARRVQDPLAELVKIDPKSIGVGQYQHDVNPMDLARKLDAVVEDCVNAVGVDVNTASAPLLARVAGLSSAVARSVVRWRDAHGAFASRTDLRQVSGLGDKTFEQCAGFLRIHNGSNPLDRSGVHPETYPLVERLLAHLGQGIESVMGQSALLSRIKPEAFVDERFGLPTVRDIVLELEKPGRDPRGHFVVARFNEGVEDIKDLKAGMVLEGTVSNVAAFGAFVDVGVHQDGLVHVSQMSERFVKDAREVVKTGQVVKVKVTEVDVARGRIGLTMRLSAALPTAAKGAAPRGEERSAARRNAPSSAQGSATRAPTGAMAAAFAKLKS